MSSVPGPGFPFPMGKPVKNGARSRRGRGRARVPPNTQAARSFCSTSLSVHSSWFTPGSDLETELAKRKAKEDLQLSGHGQIKKPKIELKEGQVSDPQPQELEMDSESETVAVVGATPPLKLETKDFSTFEINPHCSLPSELQLQEPVPVPKSRPLPASVLGRRVVFRVFDFSQNKSGIFGPPLDPKDFPGWIQLEVKDDDQKNVTEWEKEGQVFDPALPLLRLTLTILDPVNLDSLEKTAKHEWEMHVWRQRLWEKEERKAQGLEVEDDTDTESEAEEDEDDENAADNWRNDYPSTEDDEYDEEEVGGYNYNRRRAYQGRRNSEVESSDEDYGDPVARADVSQDVQELNAHFHSIEWTEETGTQTRNAFGHATELDKKLYGRVPVTYDDDDW